MTLPLIETLRRCEDSERKQVEEIVEKELLSDEDLATVIDLINRYDGIDYTRYRAQQLVESAKRRLAVFPDGEAKQALEILADYVVSRSK